jgi:hypothetical protein
MPKKIGDRQGNMGISKNQTLENKKEGFQAVP